MLYLVWLLPEAIMIGSNGYTRVDLTKCEIKS